MLPPLDIVYIFISITSFALYNVLARRIEVKNRIVFLFWVHTVTYLGFLGVYLFRKFILAHDVFAIEELIRQFTFYNSPLYTLMGFSFLASFLIYARLISEYPVSTILPFMQISLLFTILGYMVLGDPFSLYSFVGALIVFAGAVLSPLEQMPGAKFFYQLRKLPRGLVNGVLIESFLIALRAFITFFITQPTPINKFVMGSLKHVFPFSFFEPFYFNLGARCFVMVAFLGYAYWTGKAKTLVPILKNHFWPIIGVGFVYLIACYTYQDAYYLTKDKDILAALSKLNIPVILFMSVLLLDEKLTAPKVVGSLLIVCGGLIALLM